jgi:hypothetical protein
MAGLYLPQLSEGGANAIQQDTATNDNTEKSLV